MTKKSKKRANADVGLMFIAYRIRRIINILDADILKKLFQELAFFLLRIFALAKALRLHIPNTNFRTKFSVFKYCLPHLLLNSIIFVREWEFLDGLPLCATLQLNSFLDLTFPKKNTYLWR